MPRRTIKQIDKEIKRVEKRLQKLKHDRELLAMGIEPSDQLSIFDAIFEQPDPPPLPIRRPAEQLLLM